MAAINISSITSSASSILSSKSSSSSSSGGGGILDGLSDNAKNILSANTVNNATAFMSGLPTSLNTTTSTLLDQTSAANDLTSQLSSKLTSGLLGNNPISGLANSALNNAASNAISKYTNLAQSNASYYINQGIDYVTNSEEYKDAMDAMNTASYVANNIQSLYGNVMSYTSDVVNTMSNVQNYLQNGLQNDLQDLTQEIIQKVTVDMKNRVQSYLTAKVKDLIGVDTSYITTITSKTFAEQKHKPADIIKTVTVNKEEETEEKEKKEKEHTTAKAINDIKSKVAEVNHHASYILSYVSIGLSYITTYLPRGKTYVEHEIETYERQVMDIAYKYIEERSQQANEEKIKLSYSIGQKAGILLAREYNKLQDKVMKQQFDKIDQSKVKATGKAKAQIQKGILKLMGMIG